MKINYHNRRFRPVQNAENGEASTETEFHYLQKDNVITRTYNGGDIVSGNLIALVSEDGALNMRYQQVNKQGELMTGICQSTPEILPNGKIRLHEKWQWTSGDKSSGESVVEEV
ncbi:MAG: n-acetylglutamate synthase [Spirosomaceae bacterium]|nr:n-acetylglutamate synthase [Spirosomataceae bacterium]